MRPKKPFPSGNPLPENVVHHNRKPGYYRIRKQDGSLVSCPFQEESKVISLAKRFLSEKVISDSIIQGSLKSYWSDYEIYFKENARVSKSSMNGLSAIKGHLKFLMNKKIDEINFVDCDEIWNKLSFHSQKTCRLPLYHLINFLFLKGGAKDLMRQNPFQKGRPLKNQPKKKRNKMTMEWFKKIKLEAQNLGYDFIVDAMNIGFLTGMRKSDVLALKDSHISDCLEKTLNKSKARQIPQMNSYELSAHTELDLIIKKARMRRPAGCPFIIFHEYACYKDSEQKEHRNQVLSRFFDECMDECREKIPSIAKMPRSERPSFHEIRHLRVACEIDERELKELSMDLGHADTKITETVYNTHKEFVVRKVDYVPTLTGIR